jgi:4-amino-4-deoxy-L-arabinose transferase-like glycosyltransferase
MVLSYIGALKAWLYAPILSAWPPSALAIRLPVLLVGAATVLVFLRLMLRAGGPAAAGFGALLLATDPVYILTTTFDWGPVALQNFLLVLALLLAVRFHQQADHRALYGSAACCGLALWNKAIFLWLLVGLILAGVVLWAPRLRCLLSRRRTAITAACFLLGALPLLAYNVGSGFRTFRGREQSLRDVPLKISVLRNSLEGDVLFGYMTRPEWQAPPARASTALEEASLRISDLTHRQRNGLGLWMLISTIATAFWTPGRRKVLAFLLAVAALAWLQMLVTVQAGTSAHHTVTLWPIVFGFIAIALAKLAALRRSAAKLICGVVVLAVTLNALVVNQYLADWIRFGPTAVWTDAVFPLAEWVKKANPGRLVWVDWGVAEPLTLLLQGRIPAGHAIRPYDRKDWDERERERALRLLQDREAVYVDRTAGNHVCADLSRLLNGLALEEGYSREALTIVRGRHGRPMFELYRFVRH